MMRIYFLIPDVQSAREIIDELLLKRIEWRHVHVLARAGVPLEDLPEATLAQRSDLIPALARGGAASAVTGVLAGLVAMAFANWPNDLRRCRCADDAGECRIPGLDLDDDRRRRSQYPARAV